jgi:hypothetical protein
VTAFKFSKNPLPPPPEPFPLDRLPPFAQATASGSNSYGWHFSEGSNGVHPPNGNGHANPADAPSLRPHTHTPIDETRHRNHHNAPRDSDGTRNRDRKGKQRAHARDRQYDIYRPSPGAAPRGLPGAGEAEHTTNTGINGNRNAIIPGATPNRRVIPNSVFDEPDLELYQGYESPVDPRNIRPLGLDLHFDNDPNQAIDPYTLTAGILQEYANGYGAGYQAAADLRPPRARGGVAPINGPIQSSLLEPPEGRNGPASRRPPPQRWMTEPSGPTTAPAPEAGPSSAQLSSITHGMIAADAARPLPRWGEPGRDVHFERYPPGPPHSAPFPSDPIVSTTFIHTHGALQEDSGIPPSGFQIVPPPPFSALIVQGYESDTRQRPAPITSTENTRPRSHRRRTVQIDGNLADPAFEHPSGRASDVPTIRPSGLQRRTAVNVTRPAAIQNPVSTGGPNTTRPEVDRRSSGNTARDSTASWGTVESGAPSVARTILSVGDLPLANFEDGAGVRGSFHSESSLISFSRGNPFQIHDAEGDYVDRSRDNTTPRNRAASFSESVSTLRPDSATSQPAERPRDRQMASYPAPPSHAQGSRYTPASAVPTGHPPDSTTPPHRSRRSSRHFPPRVSPAQMENVTQRLRPSTTADTTWSDTGYASDAPLSNSDNALGLQLSRSPQITAPTPMVSSRAFLRSFSHDYENYP